jgi:hypothetical protein
MNVPSLGACKLSSDFTSRRRSIELRRNVMVSIDSRQKGGVAPFFLTFSVTESFPMSMSWRFPENDLSVSSAFRVN